MHQIPEHLYYLKSICNNMNKFKNTSEKGKRAIAVRWQNYFKEINKKINSYEHKQNIHLKARLIAYLMGDGSIVKSKDKRSNTLYEIGFYPDHESMLCSFLEAGKRLYNLKFNIRKNKNYYVVSKRNKVVCKDLLKIAKFGSKTWRIPFKLLSSNKAKIEWIKAFFDSESYIGKRQIQIQSVNKIGLYQLKTLLESFNINSKIYKYKRKNKNWNTNYILCIMKKEDRINYLNKIGFNHIVKFNKLTNSLK